jgi:Ca2+:H+ antiporter
VAAADVERIPWWAWAFPALASALLAATLLGVADAGATPVLLLDVALLAGTVFAAVHHAEVVAARVGEPYGSLVLAVAVTVIEVALIVSLILSGGPDKAALARDTVFAAVMIVCNGIVGLCLLAGGARHREQGFQVRGAAAALAVLATLATLTLVLPNYTLGVPGPVFTRAQLVFVGVVSLVLYGVFVFVQTVRHRDYFLAGARDDDDDDGEPAARPTAAVTLASLALLLVALVAVVLLAKTLSPALQAGVAAAGLPAAVVGVSIAALVLMPEGLAAVRAARADRLQTSLNLALGSALATIGLTIPAVAAASVLLGLDLVLGLEARDTVLLVLTLFVATLTLGTGRTTVLQGAVHLVVFAVFLFLAASP